MAAVKTKCNEQLEPHKQFLTSYKRQASSSNQTESQNVLEQATDQDEDGDTLLHIAVAQGNLAACRRLVAILKKANRNLDMRNNIMQIPLHVACITDSPAIVDLLSKTNPSSCSATDRYGNNCVHLAVKYSTKATQYCSLKSIVEVASANALEKKNLQGYTPMHVAAIEGKGEAIRLLKRAGADINSLDIRGGASPLILASKTSQREAAQALLELGANPALRTTYGETASQLASAKGDHVIGELLALYDSASDVTRTTSLLRYAGDSVGSTSKFPGKQNSAFNRQRDVKMKPFVSNRVVNTSVPLVSATSLLGSFRPTTPRNQLYVVKTERHSPANTFPSNRRQMVATSNKNDNIDQPLNFTVRKETHKENPTPQQPFMKRKSDHDDGPLDLSVKKSKTSDHAAELRFAACTRTKPSKQFTCVRPVLTNHVSPLDQPVSKPFSPMHQLTPVSSVSKRKKSSEGKQVHIVQSGYSSPTTANCTKKVFHPNDVFKSVFYVQERSSEAARLQDANGQRKVDSKSKYNQTLVDDQSIASGWEDKLVLRNGLYTPAVSYHRMIVRSKAPFRPDSHAISFSTTKPSSEMRDRFSPAKDCLPNGSESNQPVFDRGAKSYNLQYVSHRHPTLGFVSSMPPAFHLQKLPKDRTPPPTQFTIIREQRTQSDGAYYERNQSSSDRHHINRRNSAPVSAKTTNEKLDLRSYTGCLPPHYLQLLQSSGNLPIRQSNALRNVSDVLRDNVLRQSVNFKQENPETKSASPAKVTNLLNDVPNNDVAKAFDLVSSISAPPAEVPLSVPASSTNPTSATCSSDSNHEHRNLFLMLGDWSSIELGEFPAFGKIAEISSDTAMSYSPRTFCHDGYFQLNENFISENTREILKNASQTVSMTKKNLDVPNLRNVMVNNIKHTCRGCSKQTKLVPTLISNIWKYRPTSKYVTSFTNSSKVVYCCQDNFTPDPPVLSSSSLSKKPEKSQNQTTSPITRQHVFGAECKAGTIHVTAPLVMRNNKECLLPSNDLSPSICKNSLLSKHSRTCYKALASGYFDSNTKTDDVMLENVIEASEDEDEARVPVRHRPVLNGVNRLDPALSPRNGYHENFSDVIRKSLIKNVESYNKVRQQLLSIQPPLTTDPKDTYKDFHLSDLEISEDEDLQDEKPLN